MANEKKTEVAEDVECGKCGRVMKPEDYDKLVDAVKSFLTSSVKGKHNTCPHLVATATKDAIDEIVSERF